MSCSLCNDCKAEIEDTVKSLDFDTHPQGSDCEIDGNGSYEQDLEIDSNRPTDADLQFTASSNSNALKITDQPANPITVTAYQQDREVTFEVEKTGNSNPNQGELEIEIEFRRRKNRSWNSILTLKPVREIA